MSNDPNLSREPRPLGEQFRQESRLLGETLFPVLRRMVTVTIIMIVFLLLDQAVFAVFEFLSGDLLERYEYIRSAIDAGKIFSFVAVLLYLVIGQVEGLIDLRMQTQRIQVGTNDGE